MPYSNDQNQIKAGFVNYIGALLKSSPVEGTDAQRQVIAIMLEEALKLSQDKDKIVQLYSAKPIIRANIFILKQRCNELNKLPKDKIITEKIKQYEDTIEVLESMIKNIN